MLLYLTLYQAELLLSNIWTLEPFLIVVILAEEVEAPFLKLTLAVVVPVLEAAGGVATLPFMLTYWLDR